MRLLILAGIAAWAIITPARGLQQQLEPLAQLEPRVSHATRDTPVEIPLNVFQIQAPVRDSYDGAACSQIVMQYDFTASYGSPYVGTYAPPANCNFTTVVFNMTVTSAGINYDRLSLLYFGDIEVWRSTTAMPVRTGIYYTYSKDVTAYMPLLRTQQKVIMQLDNIYDSVFTGNFNVTIAALYYDDAASYQYSQGGAGHRPGTINPPDAILPISSRSSAQNQTSVFSLPDDNATVSLTLPRNVERAVVTVLASGSGGEEFWYTDVPAPYLDTFGADVTFARGHGPWREVQVLVDGRLAGVAWPEPVVFTGGISTGLWVPIVGMDALDLPAVDVDVSPWLGALCDGAPHEFALRVVGYDAAAPAGLGTVAQNWYVSGQVFLWLDEGGNQTTGTAMQSVQEDPVFQLVPTLTTYANGSNSSLQISLCASRSNLWHADVITTSKGSRNLTWQQELSYYNIQNITALGQNETLFQGVWPTTVSSPYYYHDHQDEATSTFSKEHLLSFYQAYGISPDYTAVNSTLYALLDSSQSGLGQRALMDLLYPTTTITTTNNTNTTGGDADPLPSFATRQNGTSFYLWNNTYYEDAGAIDPARGSTGATEQWYRAAALRPASTAPRAYGRHARAVDGYEPVLVEDVVSSSGGEGEMPVVPAASLVVSGGANVLSGFEGTGSPGTCGGGGRASG